jgi:hypothetical protein
MERSKTLGIRASEELRLMRWPGREQGSVPPRNPLQLAANAKALRREPEGLEDGK